MAYTSLAGILKDQPDTAPPTPVCANHTTVPAISCCHVCGKPLCRDCAPAGEAGTECGACRRPFRTSLLRLATWLSPSLPGLWALIGLLLIAYVALTAHRFSVFESREPEGLKERTRRCSLFLTQADRSDHYGQALEKEGRRDLARRRFLMALGATQRVLSDFQQTEYWNDFSGEERLETEARLRTALARFLLRCGEPLKAREELRRVTDLKPPASVQRLAHFNLAETTESESPPDAIRLYRESQSDSSHGVAFLSDDDRILDAASLNPDARRFYLTVRNMAGRFDAAEAQARIIACHERMGERLQAEVAYAELLEHYPGSEQARALRKLRGEPKAGNTPGRFPPVPALKEPPGDEEKITIIPLEK